MSSNRVDSKKKRKKNRRTSSIVGICIIVAVVVLCYLFIWGPFATNSSDDPIQIKVGHSRFEYPPLHFYSNNELTGFDVELARAVAEIINAELEFVPIDWTRREELLESGEIDVLWGGLEQGSLDRDKVAFTKSYLQSSIVLLMPADRDYAALEDLQGLHVCALNYTAAFYYLQVYNRDVIKSQRSFTPPEYQSLNSAFLSGDYDAMITDTSFASFFLKSDVGESFKMSQPVIGVSNAVGVRIDDTDLFSLIQDALDQLQSDGIIAALRSKWIG